MERGVSHEHVAQAVAAFARAALTLPDDALEREDWRWRDYEGVRYAYLFTYQELRDLATRTLVARMVDGAAPTTAQRILVQHHAAYRDLFGVLAGVRDDELDREPAPGEWSIRTVLPHVMLVESAFYSVIRYSVERRRTGDDRPEKLTQDEAAAFGRYEDDGHGTLADLLARYAELHKRVLNELVNLDEFELETPTWFWEPKPMSVRFRMHRFDAHIREHVIQIEKTLPAIGHPPRETERLVRLVYGALGEAEGALIGADAVAAEEWASTADTIRARADELARFV